jgi:hypothetical protein
VRGRDKHIDNKPIDMGRERRETDARRERARQRRIEGERD